MVRKTDYYVNLDGTIIDEDKDRNYDFIKYDKMAHCEWSLPNDLPSWVRKRTSSDPDNSITTATQILSSLDPLIEVLPLAADNLNKKRANEIEQCLLWQFYSASRRRTSPVIEDMIRSSLIYDAIAMQIIDLDYQIKSAKAANVSAKRYEYMRRYSRFVMPTYHPACVHARMSDYGPECVVLNIEKTAAQIWEEYGDQVGSKIIEMAEDENNVYKLILREHWDDEIRCVYVIEDESHPFKGNGTHDPIIIIEPYEHGLGFIPWVIRFGSNTMEHVNRYKYHPMLATILRTEEWENYNLADSLMVSKALKTAGRPDLIEEGEVNKSTTSINYDDPISIAKATPGNRVRELQPDQLDPQLYEMRNELSRRMSSSTLSNVLRNAEGMANEAYASLNLRVLTALGALKPYQRKTENGLEDACDIMMHWIEKSGKPLVSYNNNAKSKDYGKYYSIEPDEIDANSLIYKVTLKADLPIDQLQLINAANQAVNLGLSKERALEIVGFGDASQIIEESYLEKMKEAMFALMIQGMQYQQQMAMQQSINIQNMQMQAAAGQQPTGAEGMNPAEGGLPAAMANPALTRENQTGITRKGEPLAGGM